MTWAALIPLIIQYGLPYAEQLWKLWQSNTAPSQADWDQLKVLAQNTAYSRMQDALRQQGIDPASPQGQALLALVRPA